MDRPEDQTDVKAETSSTPGDENFAWYEATHMQQLAHRIIETERRLEQLREFETLMKSVDDPESLMHAFSNCKNY